MQRRSDDLCAMQPDRPCSIPNRGILNANLEGILGSFGTSTAAPVTDRLRTTQPIVRSPNLMTAPSETRYRGALVFRSLTRRLPQLLEVPLSCWPASRANPRRKSASERAAIFLLKTAGTLQI